jgi:hypothetical protein
VVEPLVRINRRLEALTPPHPSWFFLLDPSFEKTFLQIIRLDCTKLGSIRGISGGATFLEFRENLFHSEVLKLIVPLGFTCIVVNSTGWVSLKL